MATFMIEVPGTSRKLKMTDADFKLSPQDLTFKYQLTIDQANLVFQILKGVPSFPQNEASLGTVIQDELLRAAKKNPTGAAANTIQRKANQAQVIANADPNNPQDVLNAEFAAFGDFTSAIGLKTTGDFIAQAYQNGRPDTPGPQLQPWECQIGGSKFFVPPLNINVRQQFKTGTFGAGTLRQQTPPKYNSGHLETAIAMTLYFPNADTVWGFAGNQLTINFDTDSDEVIDTFLSSLRGLITQFKYAPFLPVKNAYLNSTWGITGVVMESMTVSTLPGFPFAIAVQLNMLHFNHEVYLPMIDHFQEAVHWGRFRQYVGKAALRMQQAADKNFLTVDSSTATLNQGLTQNELDQLNQKQITTNVPVGTFNKQYDWENGKNFDLYYPDHDPARVVGPDLTNFNSPRNADSANDPQAPKKWWEQLLVGVGFDINTTPGAQFDIVGSNSDVVTGKNTKTIDNLLQREYNLVGAFLNRAGIIASSMGPGQLEDYIAKRAKDLGLTPGDSQGYKELRARITAAWFAAMYNQFLADPFLQNTLDFQARRRGWLAIKEWEVPMRKLGLNPTNVVVSGVSVSMGNLLARLQVQLQDRPVYQHLGGLETRVEIGLTVFGEDDLLALRRAFEVVSGLARIEHGHAVLGFLGIKNIITALCGCKYILPMDMSVDTVSGYPHVYTVNLSFTDFDVFQQKRELLSSDQQADLIQAFSKRNPFLRLQQHWGAFTTYPDMPLDIRDEVGTIVGHYDPDFYFKSFQGIDDDFVNWRKQNQDPKSPTDHKVQVNFGRLSGDGLPQTLTLTARGMDIASGTEVKGTDLTWNEPSAANTKTQPFTPGLSPAQHSNAPYLDVSGNPLTPNTSGDPSATMDGMFADMQFRDKTGRMVRAFPTYMLWLIDEGGLFAGVKLFDNFYGLQSIVDFSVVSNENTMGDTLILRVSNLYSRLSTAFRDLLDPSIFADAKLFNTPLNRSRNLASGLSDYLVKLDSIDLKPGVRLHLRAGYSANPNCLDTIFNGTITEVMSGDVITIVAQSDAIEFGAIINSSDTEGDSGRLDGSMLSGLWMSEPRDLMVRLLTLGATGFRETVANATRGAIFSENRFGIHHFGTILYDPMTVEEEALQNARSNKLDGLVEKFSNLKPSDIFGSTVGFVNFGAIDLVKNLWNNFHRKRDYELFKRNIYPGNGLGIAQYLGGDLGDGGLATGLLPTGVDTSGNFVDPTSGQTIPINAQDPRAILGAAAGAQGQDNVAGSLAGPGLGSVVTGLATGNPLPAISSAFNAASPFLQALGITPKQGQDDTLGFDEVSFRAQTYMKTVWQLFQLCAGLLPNYIVAVRPFMERSTVFYGKPHWMYTSGVIPLSTGINPEKTPHISSPDSELSQIMKQIESQVRGQETPTQFYQRLTAQVQSATSADPYGTMAGITWRGENIDQLSLAHPTLNIVIPNKVADGLRGLHLPTSDDLSNDVSQHVQNKGLLPVQWQHPFYMDRATKDDTKDFASEVQKRRADSGFEADLVNSSGDGAASILASQTILSEDPKSPGRKPDSGSDVHPQLEQYYCAMAWDYNQGGKDNYYNGQAKVLVFNERTRKGVVCGIADRVPSKLGKVIVVSPDAWVELAATDSDKFKTGFVDDGYSFGLITIDDSNQFNVGGPLKLGAGGKPIDGNTQLSLIKAVAADKGNKVQQTFADAILSHPQWTAQKDVGTDPEKFSLKFGWFLNEVPVNFTDPTTGLVDAVGQAAAEVFTVRGADGNPFTDQGRTEGQANQIWHDFRNHIYQDGIINKIFNTDYPQHAVDNSFLSQVNNGIPASGANKNQKLYQKTLDDYLQFMWQNPYNRGWLVKTADAKFQGVVGDLKDAANIANSAVGDVPVLGDVTQGVVDFANSLPTSLSDLGSDIFGGGENVSHNWDFDRAHGLFNIWISQGNDAATQWMTTHASPGKDEHGFVGKTIEEVKRRIFDPVVGFMKDGVKAITTVATGVLALLRLNTMSLSYGMGMAGFMQQQSNLLNQAFNDSIYFNVKYGVGSLLYLADNPFTREYGEPVVEIRQPFQRLHMVNSFQHILSNGIQQNLDGVATVIKATSNHKNAVTVQFDKGSPPERQVTKDVETGLWWDAKQGLLANILHPGSVLRNVFKILNAQPDELLAKRVALYHLKNELKKIYKGELLVLGDASIRPFDLIYLGDAYEQIYGTFECHQVVHHFTPEFGFVTAITPNALVTINDPLRWSIMELAKSRFQSYQIRTKLRHTLSVKDQKAIYGLPSEVDFSTLATSLENEIKGHVQYTGGMSALVKDIQGSLNLKTLGVAAAVAPALTAPALLLGGAFVWNAAKYVTEHLLDQHGCYIEYLNHNGGPMDSGLGYNSGVAVGTQHVTTLFANSLRIPISINQKGQSRITTNELLGSLGWGTQELDFVVQDVDYWNNFINKEILKLTNRQPSGIPMQKIDAPIVTVTKAIDGQTFEIAEKDIAPNGVRLAGIIAPVTVGDSNLPSSPTLGRDATLGGLATQYLHDKLIKFPTDAGFTPTVALRISPTQPKDKFGQVVAWVFHNGPADINPSDPTDSSGLTPSDRRNHKLKEFAEQWPQIEWDSYLGDGRPYTYNWEAVLRGYVNIDRGLFQLTIPGQGVDGAR